MSDNQTITINDTEYNVADLPETVKVCINRIQSLQAEAAGMKQRIAEIDVVIAAYSDKIVEELKEDPSTNDVEDA